MFEEAPQTTGVSTLSVFCKRGSYALMAVDTEAMERGKPAGHVAKLLPLPHMRCLIGFQGSQRFLALFSAVLIGRPVAADVDVPAEIERAYAGLAGWSLCQRLLRRDTDQCIVAAWWSAGALRWAQWDQQRFGPFTRSDEPDSYVHPWHATIAQLERLGHTRAGIAMLARAQVQVAHEHEPELAAGGRLLIAELRRETLTIEDHGELPRRRA